MTEELASEAPVEAPARNARQAILEAAAQLFAERGYAAASVREVVAAAGCKKPTLYYYFDSKEQLYLEVVRSCCADIDLVVERALDRPGGVRERLSNSLRAYLDYVRSHPTQLRLLMIAERHPEAGQPPFDFDAIRQQHIDRMRDILAEGVACGELRADLDFDETVLALFGMVDHRLVLFLHGRALPEDYSERLLDLFFEGVGA